MISQPSCAPSMVSPAPFPPASRRWALRAVDGLVESSLWVTASFTALGAWMSLTLDGHIDVVGCAALALFLFVIYTLDRYRAQPEDAREAPRDVDPAAFVARHRPAFRVALAVAAAGLAALVAHRPRLLASVALSLAASAFYVVPLPLLGRRLKELPFFKNAYAPAVVVLFAVAFLGKLPDSPRALSVMAAMFIVLQLNIWAFDVKDIDDDRRAGLTLLSTIMPARTFLAALAAEALLAAVVSAFVLPAPASLAVSLTALANAAVLWRLRQRFSLRLLFFVHEALAALPLVVTLLVR